MFAPSHTDRVDWKIIEQHYSQYSLEELEEMTYPKKGQYTAMNERLEFQRFAMALD